VKYNGTTSVWEYSPLKYWDTRSSYEFYAYYPYKAILVHAVNVNATTAVKTANKLVFLIILSFLNGFNN